MPKQYLHRQIFPSRSIESDARIADLLYRVSTDKAEARSFSAVSDVDKLNGRITECEIEGR